MKWFGRKAAVSPRPFFLRDVARSEALWPRSYEAQVREGYCGNPVAQRAVRLVAEGVGECVVYDAGVGDGRRDPSTTLRAVPLPVPGRILPPALLEHAALHLLLHGNAYLQIVGDAEGAPAELFALRPERVSVEAGASGWPAAYVYKAGAARTRIDARDGAGRPNLVHVKALHPLDDHYGLGCLGAAAAGIAVHNAAATWNKALLDNAARPSGALVYAPGDGAALSADQYARLKDEMEAAFQGSANAGRPLVLDGGLTWQALGLTPAEMDFAGLKAAAARDIALAFGVPPMLLGLPGDSTYANYREANRALWRLTILPMAGKILAAVSSALAAWWPETRLSVDVDRVTALSEDRERLWSAVSGADFLTREEKREMLGFGPVSDA